MKCEHGHSDAGWFRRAIIHAVLWVIDVVVWRGSHVRIYSPCLVATAKSEYEDRLKALAQELEKVPKRDQHGQYL